MTDKLQKLLDNVVNPALALHRGGCELVNVNDGNAELRLLGSCTKCPGKKHTFNKQVIPFLLEKVDGLKTVTLVE